MCRRLGILNCRKYIYENIQRYIHPNNFSNKKHLFLKPCKVNFSSAPPHFLKKYNKFIFPGIAITSAAIGCVYFFSEHFEEELPVTIDDSGKATEKYVDPDLDENLALLNEFGAVPYLIVGAGTTANAAFRAIRANDPYSKILIIGDESFHPHMRPPLTKELWYSSVPNVLDKLSFKQWSGRERSIFFESEAFYCSIPDLLDRRNGGTSVIRGLKVVRIDPKQQIVYLDNGKTLSYKKCLLAPGGTPKNLPIILNADDDIKTHISTFKTIDDFRTLNKLVEKIKSVTIIGGGFVGSELACALGRFKKVDVIQIFPEKGNMGNILPEYLSEWCIKKVREEGVTIIPETVIKNVQKVGTRIKLNLSNGNDVTTDHVIVAIGSEPNIELAEVSGLEIDKKNGGYLVNAEFEARKNLWVAGDAASFYDEKFGRRRIQHHDHAIASGRLAGANMTGRTQSYKQQSMFWSDLGPDVGYEAVGIIDSSLETVGVFEKFPNNIQLPDSEIEESEINEQMTFAYEPKKNFQRGIVFYLKNQMIVGILLWNVFGQMSIARKILSEVTTVDNLTEVSKLFNFKEIEDDL